MNIDEYMNLASARMTADGSVVSRADLPLAPSLAGYQSEFRAITLPAVVHLATNSIHFYDGRLVWGAVYASWLRERLRILTPAAAGPS
jgi:hypothetical protein